MVGSFSKSRFVLEHLDLQGFDLSLELDGPVLPIEQELAIGDWPYSTHHRIRIRVANVVHA